MRRWLRHHCLRLFFGPRLWFACYQPHDRFIRNRLALCHKVKRRIYWDAQAERCYRGYDPQKQKFLEEDAEANAYLLREPRKPWSLTI